MLFQAKEPGAPPMLRRPGKTPLHGYVKKGDVFEWIVGPPYPYWAEPVDDEAKAAVAAAGAAPAVALAPIALVVQPTAPQALAPVIELPKAPKKRRMGRPKGSKNKPKAAPVSEPSVVPSEG